MKLSVVVPSEEYKSYAGTRIRYERIQPSLVASGIELSIHPIGSFDLARADCDVFLISKCHDARSLMIAASLRDRGVFVGVDLFDDYFSGSTDSRLIRYREWLIQLVSVCDFAVCSTEAMADVARSFHRALSVHVMNDTTPEFRADELGVQLAGALKRALDDRHIRVLWYGVGDNPYFSVGLEDLSSYGSALDELTRTNLRVSLTILTNKRALSARGLSLIHQLPIETRTIEWSEEAERALLDDCLLAFIPVNSQPFSRAKSLNRAVTALSGGCQVLSAGFPLYGQLEPFIYRDPAELVHDIQRRSLRFSSEKLVAYGETIAAIASPRRESDRLAAFLSEVGAHHPRSTQPIRLIHGHSTRDESHRLVKSLGGLSVASPYTRARFDFDVVFRGSDNGLEMLVLRQVLDRLRLTTKRRFSGLVRYNGLSYRPLGQPRPRPTRTSSLQLDWQDRSEAFQLATYHETMRQIVRDLDEAFGPSRTFYSEHSQLPFIWPSS